MKSLGSRLLNRSMRSNSALIENIAKSIAGPLGLHGELFDIADISKSSSLIDCGEFFDKSIRICSNSVKNTEEDTNRRRHEFGSLHWYALANATVFPSSSFCISGEKAYLQEEILEIILRGADFGTSFLNHGKSIARCTKFPSERLAKGIALFGNGSFNWYHWLIEILPKTLSLTQLPGKYAEYPLLVPPEMEKYPSFTQSLRAIAADREIIVCKAMAHDIESCVWVDTPSICPYNMRSGWPSYETSFHHQECLFRFRTKILECNPKRLDSQPVKKVYLKRSNARRNVAQDEVEQLLHKHGFESVACETLSFEQQVDLFRNAEYIVGPSGAAWSCLLFAEQTPKCIIFSPDQFRGLGVFANLATQASAELTYLFVPTRYPTASAAYSTGYDVPVSKLQEILNSVLSVR